MRRLLACLIIPFTALLSGWVGYEYGMGVGVVFGFVAGIGGGMLAGLLLFNN